MNPLTTVNTEALAPIPNTLSGELSNGVFWLSLRGQPGLRYQVQVSSNLVTWDAFTEVQLSGSTTNIQDPVMPGRDERLYRSLRLVP